MTSNRRQFLKRSIVAAAAASGFPLSTLAAENRVVRPAPLMPTPHYVESNGINMAVYEKGEGPVVIFCHGWPELAFSWRDQIDAVAAAV